MRTALCVFLGLLLATPAFAKRSLNDLIDEFDSALTGRIKMIAESPSPTPEELKEQAGLQKTRDVIDQYGGRPDKYGLSALAKALGYAYKASSDAGVVGAGVNLKRAVTGEGEYHQGQAVAARNLLNDDAARAKVDAAIAKAVALLPLADGESDWGKSAKIAAKAILGIDKAWASVGKYLDKEIDQHTAYVHAEWPSVVYSATPEACTATVNPDGSLIVSGLQSTGDPAYIVGVAVDGARGVGLYSMKVGWPSLVKWSGGGVADSWFSLYGYVTLHVLTKQVAAGTFSFTANSASSGTVNVYNGQFLVPIVLQ